MIELFGDWSEHVRALIELADKVMVNPAHPPYPLNPPSVVSTDFDGRCVQQIWRLLGLPTLHTWSRGRAVLIGDAAHPLLPYAAQCGAQAIEE